MNKEICKMFGSSKGEQQNVLLTALFNAAGSVDILYEYLDETPKTSLVIEIVDELNKLGYKIVKI